jgi:hypothetical protein
MFGFRKAKKDKTQEESQIIAPIRKFTLKGFSGSEVPVDKYIVLYASLLRTYTPNKISMYFDKFFEWRLYKSPDFSWVDTPDENLRLYVNNEPDTDTTGLSIAQKERKKLKYWDVIHQKLSADYEKSNVEIYEVRQDHHTNVQTIFKRGNMYEDEMTPQLKFPGHGSNLRVLLHQ